MLLIAKRVMFMTVSVINDCINDYTEKRSIRSIRGFRSRSISGAKHACDAILPDFWGTGSPPLLQGPVSYTQ